MLCYLQCMKCLLRQDSELHNVDHMSDPVANLTQIR